MQRAPWSMPCTPPLSITSFSDVISYHGYQCAQLALHAYHQVTKQAINITTVSVITTSTSIIFIHSNSSCSGSCGVCVARHGECIRCFCCVFISWPPSTLATAHGRPLRHSPQWLTPPFGTSPLHSHFQPFYHHIGNCMKVIPKKKGSFANVVRLDVCRPCFAA